MDSCPRRRSCTFSRALASTSHLRQILLTTPSPCLFFKPQYLNRKIPFRNNFLRYLTSQPIPPPTSSLHTSSHPPPLQTNHLPPQHTTTHPPHHVRQPRSRPLPLPLHPLPPRLPQRPHLLLHAPHPFPHTCWPHRRPAAPLTHHQPSRYRKAAPVRMALCSRRDMVRASYHRTLRSSGIWFSAGFGGGFVCVEVAVSMAAPGSRRAYVLLGGGGGWSLEFCW